MTRTLLYIDRDPSIRLLLQRGLSPAGFAVLEADDTAQGRAIARDARPDAVLVDLDAAGMRPAELVAALRGAPGLETAPLLASTAEDRPEHLEQAAACGFAAVLVKPLDLDALAARLESHVAPRAGAAPAAGGRTPADTPPRATTPLGTPAAAGPSPAAPGTPQASATPPMLLRVLDPLVESVVENVSAADAVLTLGGEDEELVVAAAHSVRPGATLPPSGTRIPLGAVPWLADAMRGRQPAVIDAATVAESPLMAAGITSLLVVPLTGEHGPHGALVIGERRRRTFAFPPAQVEEAVREAGRLVLVIERLARLNTAIAEARRDVERYRAQLTRTVATGGADHTDARDQALADLGARVARAMGLGADEIEHVRQRLLVHDSGRTWLRQALLPHVRVSADVRERLLALHGALGAEILRGLGWAPAIVDGGGPAAPASADAAGRIVKTLVAWEERLAGTAAGSRDRLEALAAMRKDASGGMERRVLDALAAAVAAPATTAGA